MATTRDVLCAPDVVPKLEQASLSDLPGPTAIMTLEIADVFEDYERRSMPFKNLEDLSKERAPSLVTHALLVAGLRERLTGKTGAENIVWRHLVLAFTDISVNPAMCIREILEVKLPELRINLRDEYALVAKIPQGEVEASDTCEEVDEAQSSHSSMRALR